MSSSRYKYRVINVWSFWYMWYIWYLLIPVLFTLLLDIIIGFIEMSPVLA